MSLSPMPAAAAFSISSLRQALASHTPKVPSANGATAMATKGAAVLVPIYRRSGAWSVLLCLRSNQVGEHQGEVAFPGGRMEQSDKSLVDCALREAWEEVGLRPESAAVFGLLDPVSTRTSYLVWPAVATVPDSYAFVPNTREVAELLEVPLEWLLSDQSLRHEAVLQPDGSVARRRSYAVGPHLVFGATAVILTQLLSLYRQAADGHAPGEV